MEKQFIAIDLILLMNGAKMFMKSRIIKTINYCFLIYSLYITINSIVTGIIRFKNENLFSSIASTFNYVFSLINILSIKMNKKKMTELLMQLQSSFDDKSARCARRLSYILCVIYFVLSMINFTYYILTFNYKNAKFKTKYFLFVDTNNFVSTAFYFLLYIYGCFIRQNWLISSMSLYTYFIYSVDQLDNQLTELNIITFINPANCDNYMSFKKAIVGRLTVNQIKRRTEMALNVLPFLWTSFLFLQFNNVILRIMRLGMMFNLSEIISYSSNFTFLLIFLYFLNFLENRSTNKTEELKTILTGLIYNTDLNRNQDRCDHGERWYDNYGKSIKCKQFQKLFLNELNQPPIKYTGYDVFTLEKSLMIIFTGVVANYTTLFLQLK